MVKNICLQESYQIPADVLNDVVQKSEGNLRKAILAAEAASIRYGPAYWHNFNSFSTQSLCKDWTSHTKNIAGMIAREQSPANVLAIRAILYDLLNHCIPPYMIMKVRWVCFKILIFC